VPTTTRIAAKMIAASAMPASAATRAISPPMAAASDLASSM
jgi:hypothetical protein